jgi:hypothetical protein
MKLSTIIAFVRQAVSLHELYRKFKHYMDCPNELQHKRAALQLVHARCRAAERELHQGAVDEGVKRAVRDAITQVRRKRRDMVAMLLKYEDKHEGNVVLTAVKTRYRRMKFVFQESKLRELEAEMENMLNHIRFLLVDGDPNRLQCVHREVIRYRGKLCWQRRYVNGNSGCE